MNEFEKKLNEYEKKSAWEKWEDWKNSTWGNLVPVLIAQHADRTNKRKIKGGDYCFWRNDETHKEVFGIGMAGAVKLLQEKGGIAFTCLFETGSIGIAAILQIVLCGKNKNRVKLVDLPS